MNENLSNGIIRTKPCLHVYNSDHVVILREGGLATSRIRTSMGLRFLHWLLLSLGGHARLPPGASRARGALPLKDDLGRRVGSTPAAGS